MGYTPMAKLLLFNVQNINPIHHYEWDGVNYTTLSPNPYLQGTEILPVKTEPQIKPVSSDKLFNPSCYLLRFFTDNDFCKKKKTNSNCRKFCL